MHNGSILKFGTISKVDADKGLCRVYFPEDDLESKWLPVIQKKVLNDKFFCIPDLKENVACMMDCKCETGVILGAIYTNKTSPNADVKGDGVVGVAFSDGVVIKYDKNASKLTIDLGDSDVDISCNRADITASDKIYLNGDAEISGDLDVLGDIRANGNVIAGEINPPTHVTLLNHVHVETSATTNAPTPGL